MNYGATTGNYSAASIRSARSANSATAGDQLIKDKSGVFQFTDNTSDDYSDSNLYSLQERKRLQALDAARKSGLNALAEERKTVDPYYNKAISTVSGNSASGARNLAEYLAQRGQTQSGVAAQAEINRVGTLNNNVTGLETERANTFADIAARETGVNLNYDQGKAEAKIDTQIAEATALQNAQAAQAEYQKEFELLGYKNDLAKELAREKAQLDLNNELATIQERAKYSKAASPKVAKPTLTYAQAKEAYENGERSQAIENAISYYTGQSTTYRELNEKISGMSNPLGAKAWIQYYNQNGKISDEEATYLLKQYRII